MSSNKYTGSCRRCHKPVEARKGTVEGGRIYHMTCATEQRRELQGLQETYSRPRRRVFYPAADETGSKAYGRRKP